MLSVPKRLSLSESYPAVPSSVPTARAAVVEFARAAGVVDGQLDSLRLAVTEAVTNAVVHAFGPGGGQVHLTAAVASGEVWVLIADDGCGFLHPVDSAPGLGWGLALIAYTCDQFEIAERASGGTELRMCFRLAEAA